MSETALTVAPGRAIMPVMNIQEAAIRRQAIVDFTKAIMVPGKDFGTVPGTGDKPTLLKPGAEKLTTLFGLSPRFEIVEKVMDWTGDQHGNEPFFYLQYRCALWYGDVIAGEGLGSCNSWEKKYRYRKSGRVCPSCGKETINKSKFAPRNAPPNTKPGWYCYAKVGGCGMEFAAGDPQIEQQESGQAKNDNPADLVNTIDKMAQKRALVAATLIAVNASEFFTQDIEDMGFGDIIEGEIVDDKPPAQKNGSGNGHKPAPEPQAPPTPAVLRAALARNTKPTFGTVVSMAVSLGLYNDVQEAYGGVGLWDKLPPNMDIRPGKLLKTETALELFDWLVTAAPNEPAPETAVQTGLLSPDDEQSLNSYDAQYES